MILGVRSIYMYTHIYIFEDDINNSYVKLLFNYYYENKT